MHISLRIDWLIDWLIDWIRHSSRKHDGEGGRILFRKAVEERLLPLLSAFKPDLIIMSSGKFFTIISHCCVVLINTIAIAIAIAITHNNFISFLHSLGRIWRRSRWRWKLSSYSHLANRNEPENLGLYLGLAEDSRSSWLLLPWTRD